MTKKGKLKSTIQRSQDNVINPIITDYIDRNPIPQDVQIDVRKRMTDPSEPLSQLENTAYVQQFITNNNQFVNTLGATTVVEHFQTYIEKKLKSLLGGDDQIPVIEKQPAAIPIIFQSSVDWPDPNTSLPPNAKDIIEQNENIIVDKESFKRNLTQLVKDIIAYNNNYSWSVERIMYHFINTGLSPYCQELKKLRQDMHATSITYTEFI